ncbi:uncharacterized protein LOC127263114 isoform X2 [Andrographis paniculata]|uniref:uncharacterized protein LOC127263114 isoform X2 n=1 Tax=Andrographis paniculata TaxID=175694 RepID=UPI0021E93D20|nr:uncharacterized protein LOC127263114 isoform X2 [Andrographis paniculata]
MDRSSLGRGSTSSAASGSGTASSKEEKIDQLFYRYATKSSGVIDPSGIDLLCADLQLDDKDYQMLLLSWKMKARRKGYFTVEEWRRGLTTLHAYTLPKLRDGIYTLYLESAIKFSQIIFLCLQIFFDRCEAENLRHRNYMRHVGAYSRLGSSCSSGCSYRLPEGSTRLLDDFQGSVVGIL